MTARMLVWAVCLAIVGARGRLLMLHYITFGRTLAVLASLLLVGCSGSSPDKSLAEWVCNDLNRETKSMSDESAVLVVLGNREEMVGNPFLLPKGDWCVEGVLFRGKQVRDSDLSRLNVLARLRVLELEDTSITDAGLESLSNPTQLSFLRIERTNITDAGLASVTRMKALEVLDLRDIPVSGDGLRNVANLGGLKELKLIGLSINDDALQHLSGLKKVSKLCLWKTTIGDGALKYLVQLENLRDLDLTATRVTDEGLNDLAGLAQLKSVVLHKTQVTDSGAAHLKEKLPNCCVSHQEETLPPIIINGF